MLDLDTGSFLSTERRRELLTGLPILSVPVLFAGTFPGGPALRRLIGPSNYKSARWQDCLAVTARNLGLDPAVVAGESDASSDMEGLYVKVEQDGQVVGRYKLVRPSFLTAILESGSHWLERPILPNQLRDGVDLYAPTLTESAPP